MITCTFEKGYTAHLRHVVVHAIVEKDGALLLAKRQGDIPETGMWCLPGGYLAMNETAPDGALRELREETGWEGEIVSVFRINANPFRRHDETKQNISIEFIVRPIKQAGAPDHESSKVEWIPIENLFWEEQFAFDHRHTIDIYLSYRKKPFTLPLFE